MGRSQESRELSYFLVMKIVTIKYLLVKDEMAVKMLLNLVGVDMHGPRPEK